ncbi:MAG TPA: DUF2330 domain-containing protein, partial [Labilithrix sp.]
KTLSREIFARVEQLSSPRLVEYWERDPCAKDIGLDGLGTIGHGAGTGSGFGNGHGRLGGSTVTVEAQFEVGEYEIVILGAEDSTGLDTWLREHGYKIPPNADKALAPYVAAGSKFFVAKVNVAKVKMENGRASLSPLRFHYDSDKFELPVKLGLLNSAGTQDLVVYVVANDRYEVANAPNVTIPTNLDVSERARGSFGAFYAALFDDTVAKHPGAVVTEYAWQTSNCDPCPGNAVGISPSDLASLGADALPGIWWSAIGARGGGVTVRQGKTTVSGGLPDTVVQRIVRQNFGRFRLCYENGLRSNPELKGRVSVKFGIDAKGSVVDAADAGSEMKDPSVIACIVRGFGNLGFPEPVEKKATRVTYEIDFAGGATAPPQPAQIPKGPVILTRLHTRYGKDALGNDLVFRVAPPIVGGREDAARGAKPDTGAKTTTGASNFQARYVIRHGWPGAVACDDPQRGIWGGPWPDAGVAPETQGATSLAYAPRGAGITLASFTGGPVPDLPIANGDAGSPLAADAGSDAGASPEPTRGRCGCRAVGSDRAAGSVFALVTLAALAALRRRR